MGQGAGVLKGDGVGRTMSTKKGQTAQDISRCIARAVDAMGERTAGIRPGEESPHLGRWGVLTGKRGSVWCCNRTWVRWRVEKLTGSRKQ